MESILSTNLRLRALYFSFKMLIIGGNSFSPLFLTDWFLLSDGDRTIIQGKYIHITLVNIVGFMWISCKTANISYSKYFKDVKYNLRIISISNKIVM